ncbi:MAG: methyl-accepting chemotaxis protein [Candidatus Hodarchaeales archaeon]|jgi:methyl-accepting chemotaxis protein
MSEESKYSVENTNMKETKGLFEKILSEPNILKALPVLIVPTLVTVLIGLFLLTILPDGIKNQVGLNNYVSLIIAVGILIPVRLYYKNGLYFRLSLATILLVFGTTLLSRLNHFMGDIVVQYSLGEMLIQTLPSAPFIALMTIYIVKSIQQPLDTLKKGVQKVSEGDLTSESVGLDVYGTEFGTFEDALQVMKYNFRNLIGEIQTAAEQLTTSSEEFAASAEEVNASSEEISSVIQQMNHGAQQQAEQINATVRNVDDLSTIAERTTQDIASTVELISDVANQTNMLSLNAQIEAARAGSFGKSFMVVADNVRRLAEDTKASANNVQELVTSIQQQISTSVEIIAKSVDSVAAVAEETAASSEEASAATEEQTSTMEEMSASSQELARLAQELVNSTVIFKVKEDQRKKEYIETTFKEKSKREPLIARIAPIIKKTT